IVIPRVAPLLAGGAERQFLVLILLRFRIVMRRREQNLIAAGTEKRARRLPDSRRNPFHVAAGEIERIDLVEGIARFTLALKDKALAIGRPVAFSRAAPLDGKTTNPCQEIALLVLDAVCLKRRGCERDRRQHHGCTHRAYPSHPGTSDCAIRV